MGRNHGLPEFGSCTITAEQDQEREEPKYKLKKKQFQKEFEQKKEKLQNKFKHTARLCFSFDVKAKAQQQNSVAFT